MHEGLSDAEARRRLARDGPNELAVSKPRSVLHLLGQVVAEPMFLLLVACGAVYMVLGDRNEALMLLGFVVVVIGITFAQQRRTERSLEALRDLSSPQALVVRDGEPRKAAGRELVCDDIVLLAEGDRVPADMDLVEASNLTVDESMLTGESVPVPKLATAAAEAGDSTAGCALAGDADAAAAAKAADEAGRRVFSGTLVTQGTARGRVIATGERSALGRIGKSLEGLGGENTPIQQETRRVVKVVAIAGLALATGLAIAYWLTTGEWLHGLLAGLTFAMAVLPEELPVVLTLFLGLGAWRLSREKVLARSIPAIELLGAATVLCVDKTGTLTTNRMAVRRLWTEAMAYDSVEAGAAPLPEALHDVLEFAVLASHRRAFDPMESAIVESGRGLLANTEHLHADWTLVDDYPLSREMLAMSRVWQSPDRRERMIAAKGAPEAIVDLCHMDVARAAAVAAQVAALADNGLRVLGVARSTFDAEPLPGKQHDFAFEFLGLVALADPVRADVPAAIAECRAAGIRVVMITGDHPATAISIARQAGLACEGRVMTGTDLSALSDEALGLQLAETRIFCRVRPEQKLRLVQAFRARGDVVAMTGDGVNDAPALKAANIGVAMGARGTDVAREAAALVLLNDDFASLVTAVRYGRRVFANLRKAIVFVVAVHVPCSSAQRRRWPPDPHPVLSTARRQTMGVRGSPATNRPHSIQQVAPTTNLNIPIQPLALTNRLTGEMFGIAYPHGLPHRRRLPRPRHRRCARRAQAGRAARRPAGAGAARHRDGPAWRAPAGARAAAAGRARLRHARGNGARPLRRGRGRSGARHARPRRLAAPAGCGGGRARSARRPCQRAAGTAHCRAPAAAARPPRRDSRSARAGRTLARAARILAGAAPCPRPAALAPGCGRAGRG